MRKPNDIFIIDLLFDRRQSLITDPSLRNINYKYYGFRVISGSDFCKFLFAYNYKWAEIRRVEFYLKFSNLIKKVDSTRLSSREYARVWLGNECN